ncbi:MAG: hypothetical protein IH620_04840 [Ignavibacterium sp.]|nr:hypothetical protein [Ignavibacterium sp.]
MNNLVVIEPKVWRNFVYGLILVSQILFAQNNTMIDGKNGNLVSHNWLLQNLNNPNLIILDASPLQIYNEKHITGAVGVNATSWFGINEIQLNEMEKILQSWGLNQNSKVIIYDQGGSIMATRLFYALYYYGFPEENLYILDGGLAKWEEAGLEETNKPKQKTKDGTFKIEKINEESRGRLPEILTATGNNENNILIEALDESWHYGQFQMFSRAGHIPNSTLLPTPEFYNHDKTFKTPEEISKMLEYYKINPERQIYSYCGGGIAASVPFFVLKFIMGYPNVELFVESELGWLKDERELPFWTYDAPYLMKDAKWLKTWSGKLLRMYYDPQISIIDIRRTEEYKTGHIEFAKNIPYEKIRKVLDKSNELGEILSEAGTNKEDEIIIVSGEGITKEAALVYCMIADLGQKKVSILNDSMVKWNELGYTIISDTSKNDKLDTTNETLKKANNYTKYATDEIIIDDFNKMSGKYQQIFILSDENTQINKSDHKVINIPSINFLNADGTLKEAKEIWAIIAKAEVPRYTELVCFSEDPSYAALNYFIFKVMGYPYVKVWLN